MDKKLEKWVVTLDTPRGAFDVEVPTFLGKAAAERRAHVSLVAARYGDLDEVKVRSSKRVDE